MRAVIYARVSSDQTGQFRSVESQVAECRAICSRNGWEVAEVLVDNDRGASRHSTKDRPEYKKLAKILKPGDVLVTWEASRAQRDLSAYLQLRNLCEERNVLWCYSGRTYDLSEGDARFSTGLDALLAEREAEQIRDRVLRGKRAAALSGRPAGRPPWGYRRQLDPQTGRTVNWVIDEVDGPIVRDVINRTLAGESLWSIVRDLEIRGVEPRQVQRNAAKRWRPQPLRVTLLSPSYCGLRTHQGEAIGPGTWEAMVSREEHERLVTILRDPARRTTHHGPEPIHLLTGIATCGVCEGTMRFFGPKSLKTPTYLCETASCVRRRADLVDMLVTETLIRRMEKPDAIKLFATQDNADVKKALADADLLRARLQSYVDKAISGAISETSFAKIEAGLLPQIAAAEAKARAVVMHPLVAKLAGPDAREKWKRFTIPDRRTVVRSLLTIKILKATKGNTRRFDPLDVDIKWKTNREVSAI